MTTDPENSNVPPSQTSDSDAPAEQAGSVAPGETPAPDPELGLDPSAADVAEAITSGGANLPDEEGVEPATPEPATPAAASSRADADAAMNPAQAVEDYHASKAVR
jgi:hypothetical protein